MKLEKQLNFSYSRNLAAQWRFLSVSCFFLYPRVKRNYGIEGGVIESGEENLPRSGPALILNKHSYDGDSFGLFEVIRKRGGNASYTLKAELNNWITKIGGIKLARYREIRKYRQHSRALAEKALEKNNESIEHMKWLYRKGEIIVSHPEGTTYPDKVGKIGIDAVFMSAAEAQLEIDQEIGVVPVGHRIDSAPSRENPVTVHLRIGTPFPISDFMDGAGLDEDGLVQRVTESLSALSDIKK